jgi:hypothetical protein
MVEKRNRWIYGVLVAIVVCLILSFLVSLYVGTPSQPDLTQLPMLFGKLPVTDFSEQAHWGYDWAVFISALISVMTPLIQRGFVLFVKTLFKNGREAQGLPSTEIS